MESESWYWQKTWASFRTGNTALVMTWKGGSAQVTIYSDGVPKTAQAFLERLPLELPVVHVA